VLQHRERIDNTGYPEGLRGDALLIKSRIIGVADIVGAMVSHRPCHPALRIDSDFTRSGNIEAHDMMQT